jgi:hypothetical protein
MEQIKLKWLEDKERHASIVWFCVDGGDPVHLNGLVNQHIWE